MLEYIAKIQRKLIDKYSFPEDPDRPGIPMGVHDGAYPMVIDGKLDRVEIEGGRIYCCRFD